ncbi:MAG: class I SAM-dependent methyltransferase [Flavobacteriales bacterium]|nr:class I SAM-dependent methyltransferase [Flavobacteriales bacterium]
MDTQDLDMILEIPNNFTGRGFYSRIHAEQDPFEIRELAKLVSSKNPKVIVEIGTYKGGTLFIWTRTNPLAELIVSIDLPGGQFGGGYDIQREKLYRLFSYDRPNLRMEFLRGNSHLIETVTKLKKILGDRLIDFLYIDADHTFDGVKTDFELYAPLVRKGGLIAFHDIYNMKPNHEVRLFWKKIKQNYHHREILGPATKTGTGVLFI